MASLNCRLARFCLSVLVVTQTVCFGEESVNRRDGRTTRSKVEKYINWLPSKSETLIVVQQPYQIPKAPDKNTRSPDRVFHEMHFGAIFGEDARELLVGKTIKLSIEASTRFRMPDFPKEVGNELQLVGVGTKFDGCYLLVFDETTELHTKELFERLLKQSGRKPNPHVASPARHRIEGHEVIEFVTNVPFHKRTRGAKETPEHTRLIDAALSVRYWIAAPSKGVLVVATSQSVLKTTLHKVVNPDQKAFPATLPEWNHISGTASIWGMRHFKPKPRPSDFSDFRQNSIPVISGFTFEIDPKTKRANATFIDCDSESKKRLRSSVEHYVWSGTRFTETDTGVLVAKIDWSKPALRNVSKLQGDLSVWLIMYLGHAVLI